MRRHLAVILLLVAVGAANCWWLMMGDIRSVLSIHEDDVGYYLAIAQHLAHGDGFTFDGVNQTNGFHPLWLFVLGVAARFFSNPYLFPRVAMIMQVVMFLGVAVTFYLLLEKSVGTWVAAAAALAVVTGGYFAKSIVTGLETPLFVLLALLTLLVFERWRSRKAFALGALCGLVTLARLEGTLLGLTLALQLWRTRARKQVALLVAGAALVALPWWTFSLLRFGTFFPVSGTTKHLWSLTGTALRFLTPMRATLALFDFWSVFNARTPIWQAWIGNGQPALPGGDLPGPAVTLNAVCCVVLVGLVGWRWKTASPRPGLSALVAFGVSLPVLQKLYYALGGLPYYYTAVFNLAAVAALALVVSSFARTPRARAVIGLVACLALGLVFRIDGRRDVVYDGQPHGYAHLIEVGERLRGDPLPLRVGGWNSGLIGYFSGGKVTNLDGKVNTLVYYKDISEKGYFGMGTYSVIWPYLQQQGIGYIADLQVRLDEVRQAKEGSWQVYRYEGGSADTAGVLALSPQGQPRLNRNHGPVQLGR